MNRRVTSVVSALAVAGVIPVLATTATAHASAAATAAPGTTDMKLKSDNMQSPLALRRVQQHEKAAEAVSQGTASFRGRGVNRTVRLDDGSLVDYPTSQTAKILTFLVQFGDQNTNPAFPDDAAGPLHNQIPQPSADDNSTYWQQDFSPEHYKEMFFTGLADQNGESFHNVYKEMSNGKFDAQGDVSDWVTLPKSEASYQDASGGETQQGMTSFIGDSADTWYADRLAKDEADGMSPEDAAAEIKTYLQSFDQWDRYDIDGDGIYNEPDGYIDHFEDVHAGRGEEDGSPAWAIWSHRWSAGISGYGTVGPQPSQDCTACFPIGGVEIGDSGIYIYDYTTEPENGGLGVFSHEFGHDLGLPDFYDTDDGDNSTGNWTLMSAGSWMGHGNGSIGTTPDQMDATSKIFLGWYGPENLATVDYGTSKTITLGPSYHAIKDPTKSDGSPLPQATVVNLPDGKSTQTAPVASPDGAFLYSGTADATDALATSQSFTVPAGGTLTAKVNYNFEPDFDYGYVDVSTDQGATWTPIPTSLSAEDGNPNGADLGHGITGTSGTCTGTTLATKKCSWVDLTADLSAYAGQSIQLGFEAVTDANTHGYGLEVDDVAVGQALNENFTDTSDWTLSSFYAVGSAGTFTVPYTKQYVAENMEYKGYDATLATGPYNFGWQVSAPDKVEHFPYQNGLLIWYMDGLYGDNNTINHPGYGQALPVDAHSTPLTWTNGSRVSERVQTYDATFGLEDTDPLNLHREVADSDQAILRVPSQPAVPVFDDTDSYAYWSASDPMSSSKVAGSGTQIKVLSQDDATGIMKIAVGRAAPEVLKAPKVTGTAKVGQTLTATHGTWTETVTSTFQWLRNGSPISGATRSTYKAVAADAGKRLSVRETATYQGSLAGVATSAATAAVAKASTTTAVKVGAAKVNKKVTATITVTASGITPTGKVTVTYAGKKLTATLKSGKATVSLPAHKKGTYSLKASYVPAAGLLASSRTVKAVVK